MPTDPKQIVLAESIANYIGWIHTTHEFFYEELQPHGSKGEPLGMALHLELMDSRHKYGEKNYDRAKITGAAPFPGAHNYLDYQDHFPSITVSLAKSIPQIVTDINRRIMPEYRTQLLRIELLRAARQREIDEQNANALVFARLMEQPPPKPREIDDSSYQVHVHLNKFEVYGEIEVGTKAVKIDLDHIPKAVAASMLVPLAEFFRTQPPEKAEDE